MSPIERPGLATLRAVDPEAAHGRTLRAMKYGPGPVSAPRLIARLPGLDLPNPVGLAAGFDKNAIALAPLMSAGFGFLEVGTATLRPRPGNPTPRMFLLPGERSAVNRFGFNNDGVDAIVKRLAARPKGIPVGLSIDGNALDSVLRACLPHVDFVTVNVSCPNVVRGNVQDVLAGIRDVPGYKKPLFLKISPDSTISSIIDWAGIDAIVATNTRATEGGGLSGAPLFDGSTRVLARLSQETDIPLIGVGGIGSAEQAYAKIKAGASAVQLHTALLYDGVALAARIATELDALLERDGFANVAEAVGTGHKEWLGSPQI